MVGRLKIELKENGSVMKNKTILVSYATKSYDKVYNKFLGASCKKLKLLPRIHYEIEDNHPWLEATLKKPGIIIAALENNESVLYVDSDATITTKSVMDIDSLIPKFYYGAFVMLNHSAWYRNNSEVREPLTGTLFFRQAALPMLLRWQELCYNGKEPDGVMFERVFKNDYAMFLLDIKWCYINSLPMGMGKGGIPCDDPWIIHQQESRRRKK